MIVLDHLRRTSRPWREIYQSRIAGRDCWTLISGICIDILQWRTEFDDWSFSFMDGNVFINLNNMLDGWTVFPSPSEFPYTCWIAYEGRGSRLGASKFDIFVDEKSARWAYYDSSSNSSNCNLPPAEILTFVFLSERKESNSPSRNSRQNNYNTFAWFDT